MPTFLSGAESAPAIIAAGIGLTVALLCIGIFRRDRIGSHMLVQRRVDRMITEEEGADPLERSFVERVMQPVLATILSIATGVLPTRIIGAVHQRIEVAGRPTTTNRFLTLWALVGVCFPLAVGLLLVAGSGSVGGGQLLLLGLCAFAGLYLPWNWLGRKAQERSKAIARSLPDAIDLIITNVEAGLGMQASLLAVAEKFRGPIGEEFKRVVREISVGADRTQALTNMAQRAGAPEMRLFARAMAQAEQTGIPIARVLRNHSTELREKRRQRAREQAAKIPVKITLPTVLVMFPTLFLLILGPVVLNAMEQFG